MTDILLRDYLNPDGTVRRLDLPAAGLNANGTFSPFALDGTLRTDLIGTAGMGFYHIGALHAQGTEMKSNATTDSVMIAQSLRAARIDLKADEDTVHIRAMESTPLTDALRFDQPLASLQDYGTANYSVAKAAQTLLIERQVIALGFDGGNVCARVYPRVGLKERPGSEFSKDNPDICDVTYEALLCPFAQYPVSILRDGSSWRGLQGYPVFGAAPVATAVSGQKATVAFTAPTSNSSTLTYTVNQSNSSTGPWSPSTIASVTGTTNITINLTGVTSSLTWYFQVVATGTNQYATTSATSNSIIGLT